MKKKNKKRILDFAGSTTSLGREMIDKLIEAIEKQQKTIDIDVYKPERDEVINGLFFRTLRFYHSFVLSFHFWSMDMAEVIARMMLESKIYLKFLLQEDKYELFLEFIKYGIGQDKLYKLHLARLIDEGKMERTDSLINFIDSSTDEEIWDELVSIRLKNFGDLHKISNQIDMRDSYALEYQPYSTTIHGHWTALTKYYLRRCTNNLHRFHYIGTTQLPPLDPRFVFSITSIFYDSYLMWTKEYKLKDKAKPLLDKYTKDLEKLMNKPVENHKDKKVNK